MAIITLPHALPLSFLVISLLLATSTTTTTTAISHSLPYSTAPSQPPSLAPTPSHHHHHNHTHHSHHLLSPSLAPSPSYHPSKPPTQPLVKPPAKAPAPYSKPAKPPTQPLVKPPTKAPAPQAKPPTKAPAPYSKPVKPPTKAPAPYRKPVKPPTKAPAPAPAPYSKPMRKLVAVQGMVYCKNCSYVGVDTLLGSSPLSGATVELRCNNTKYTIKKTQTTDKNGYFFLQSPKYITTYGSHKCRVFLTKLPKNGGPCSHATNLNGGLSGAFLFLDKNMAPPTKPLPYTIYTVGPFAYEPPKCYKH